MTTWTEIVSQKFNYKRVCSHRTGIQQALAQAIAFNIVHKAVNGLNNDEPVIHAVEQIYSSYDPYDYCLADGIAGITDGVYVDGVRCLNVQHKELFSAITVAAIE